MQAANAQPSGRATGSGSSSSSSMDFVSFYFMIAITSHGRRCAFHKNAVERPTDESRKRTMLPVSCQSLSVFSPVTISFSRS
jgi:hypothetical protein